MPITGKFVADFASFQDAVQKATTSLVGMETGAGKVSTRLNKMVDEFSGRKIIQDAELMSQAFEQLASKGIGLTNKELQRMGSVADEAIAKLKAGGEAVPPGMQKIADAAKNIKPQLDQAQGGMDRMFTTLKSIGGVLGIAFSAQALVGFVGSVFSAASSIKDLSDRLGVSTDAVQKFKFAAEQGGGSIDDVGASIAKMNDNLATGSKETYEAIKLLGLSFDTVRRQSPEDAFLGITDALKNIEDPMLRTRLQMDLFGKGSAGLSAQIASGFREAADAAEIMSDQTIKDLEAAQQAWENLGNKVVIVSGNIIASTMRAVSEVTKSWDKFLVFVGNASTMGVGAAAALASATAEATSAASALETAFGGSAISRQAAFNTGIARTKVELAAAEEAAKKAKAAAKELADEFKRLGAEDAKRIADGFASMVEVFNKATSMAATAMQGFAGNIDNIGTKVNMSRDAFFSWLQMVSKGVPVVSGLGTEFARMGSLITPIYPKLEKVKVDLGDLSKALADLATVSGGTFSTMVSGLSSVVSAAHTARESMKTLKDGMKAFDKGKDMEGILGMSTGIMGIVTAAATAVNAIKALWSAVDRNKGRDAVEDFADSFGGFDALHAKLLEMGDAGEALWVKLTQGVGRNNPEQAARIIAEVEAALRKQAEASGEAQGATEEQAQATIETATQAAKALEELGPRIKANEDEWRAWGDVVTAQIQKIADKIRALPMPGTSSMGSGSGATSGGGGGGGSDSATVTSNLIVSGRVLATVTSEAALGW